MNGQDGILQGTGEATQGSSQLMGEAGNTSGVSREGSLRTIASRSSTRARRLEIEAERDEKMLQLKKTYADKMKEKKSMEIKLRSLKRRIDSIGGTTDPTKIKAKSDMESEHINVEESLDLLKIDLESIEYTFMDELDSIKSKCEAELAQLSDDEYGSLSDHGEDEQTMNDRTKSWAEAVANETTIGVRNAPPPPPETTEIDLAKQPFNPLPFSGAANKPIILPSYSVNYSQPGNAAINYQPIIPTISYQPNAQAKSYQSRDPAYQPRDPDYQPRDPDYQPRDPACQPGNPTNTYQPHRSYRPPTGTRSGNDRDAMMMHIMNEQLKMMEMSHHQKRSYVDKRLPVFDGDPGLWISFKESFNRSTIKHQFDDEENMMRLQDSLKGEAKAAVLHLLANPRNLKTVLETLESRFGRSDFIIDHCIQKLKAMKKPDLAKAETIDEFGRAVEALVVNICSFNEQEYLWNKQLMSEIADMTPASWRQQWYEYRVSCGGVKLSLQSFLDWLRPKVEAVRLQIKPKLDIDADREKKRSRTRGPGAMNVAAGEEDERRSRREACPVCQKKNHQISDCWKFQKLSLEERWSFVKDANMCISCLNKGHRAKECTEGTKCTSCMRLHHPLLHGEKKIDKREYKSSEKKEDKESCKKTEPVKENEEKSDGNAKVEISETGVITVTVIEGCDGPLQIVKINAKGSKGNRRVYAMLDSGASRSFIKKSIALQLGITGERLNYSYSGVTGDTVRTSDAMKVNFEVAGDYRGSKYLPLRKAMTVDDIKIRPYSFNLDEAKKQWPHLKKMKGSNLVNVVPDIIIGNNNPLLYLPKQVVKGSTFEPMGLRTPLGWTVAGEFDSGSTNGSFNSMQVLEGTDDHLHELIKQSFSLDAIGVTIPKDKGNNLDEKRAYSILKNTTSKTEHGWETGLLWREEKVQFPDSYTQACKRLLSVERKMNKDPLFKKMYHDKIAEYKLKGYIRKASRVEMQDNPRKWIIPHFGITNENKPGKFRFIMDAKAKSNGVSLNDKLLKGPDLIRPLISVLLNFRRHEIAITGDIADMFHRVRIRQEDQQSQHLLWRDGDTTKKPEEYIMEVMIFGASSSPSSAIYVKNVNAEAYKEMYPEASKAIVDNMYVDDLLHSVRTVNEACSIRRQISEICESGGFIVRKWISNNPEVLASIPKDLQADGVKDLKEHCELPTERVLGLWWNPNPEVDAFTFRLNLHKVPKEILEGDRPTKRQLCSMVMSLYDPLGFINHYKVKGMMLLQDTWRSGIGWDDEISSALLEKWTVWLSKLEDIKTVRIPRVFSRNLEDAESVELHTFVDSSEESFCAVSYLRIKHGEQVDVAFVTSKVRVAPLKKTTIPRLELQAALLGSRIANNVEAELGIKITVKRFWSDSTTVLQWIRSRAIRFQEFVANRIGEIQETTEIHHWKWVPTGLNVADIATRFNGEISFDPDGLWYTGPLFLLEEERTWPKEKIEEYGLIAAMTSEIFKDNDRKGKHVLLSVVVPDVTRFSSYLRLVRASAAVKTCGVRWLTKIRKKKMGQKFTEEDCTPALYFSADDLQEAEGRIIKAVQEETYFDDLRTLKSGRQLSKESKLYSMSPVLINGIIRVRGRIGAANTDDAMKQPIIMPAKHYVTELIINLEHNKCAHQGNETVLANLRKQFWITRGRQAVKSAIMKCQECKLKKAKPLVPEMGDLPHHRLASYQPAFTFTGLDCFGPMEVTVGRRHEKRWGLILCCMVTRAVHLEIVHNMSTDEMMMALSRFVDSRGRPKVLISDNGTNFVGASNELKKAWKEINFEEIKRHGKFQHIDWRFNPPAAPHMGGAWERLVQSVKKCLSSILKEKYPKDTTLLTCFKAIENLLNSRPLTFVSSDVNDPEPLTPNHLLRGGCDVGPGIPAMIDDSAEFMRVQWKRSQLFADQFWRRWTDEYLPKLIRREKWQTPCEPIQRGDIVYVVDNNAPRNLWQRGVITKTFPAPDGQVRVLEVTTVDANGKKTTFRRPTCKVCPLGLRMEIQ